MSINGKDSLTILGAFRGSKPSNGNIRGYNTDSGSVPKDGNLEPNKINNKKESIFEIIDRLNSNNNVGEDITSTLYKPDISNDIYKRDNYGRKEIKDYYDRFEKIIKGERGVDGNIPAVFSFDIETLGESPLLNVDASDVNKKSFAITDFALWKRWYDNESKQWKSKKISNFSSSPEDISLDGLLTDTNANSTTKVTLERIAAHSIDGAVNSEGFAERMATDIDITDNEMLIKGKENINKMKFKRVRKGEEGFEKYKEGFENRILKPLLDASEENDSIISTVNGLGFDLPIIQAEMEYLELNPVIGESSDGSPIKKYDKLFQNHYDNQIIQSKFIEDLKFDIARELGYDESLRLEDQVEILKKTHPEIEKEINNLFGSNAISHTASYDTFATSVETVNTYMQSKSDIEKYLNISGSNLEIGENTMFVTNNAFVSNSSSMHYKVKDGVVNSYNSTILPRNNAYEVKVSKVKSADEIKNILLSNGDTILNTETSSEALNDIENKVLVNLKSLIDGEEAHMIYDDIDGVQKDLIDSGIFEIKERSDDAIRVLKNTRREMDIDYARKVIDGMGSAKSWKKIDYLDEMLNQYQDLNDYTVPNTNRKLTRDEVFSLLDGKSISIDSTDIKPEDVLTRISRGRNIDGKKVKKVIPERASMLKQLYEELDSNAKLHSNILNEIKSNSDGVVLNVGSKYDKSEKWVKEIVNDVEIKGLTTTYGETMNTIENEIIKNIDDTEALRYIVGKDKYAQKVYNKILEKGKFDSIPKGESLSPDDIKLHYNNYKPTPEEELSALNTAFKARHREVFDKNSRVARDLLKGKNAISGRSTSIDIIGSDGEYTSLPFESKKSFKARMKKLVFSHDYNNTSKNHKTERQNKYVSKIIEDLQSRGLIDFDESLMRELEGSKSVRAKIGKIASQLFDNRDIAYSTIEQMINTGKEPNIKATDAISIGYEKLKGIYEHKGNVDSNEFALLESNKVFNFIDNRVMTDKYTGKENKIMGHSYHELVEKYGIDVSKITKEAYETNMPKFLIAGGQKDISNDILNSVLGGMYQDLDWTESNIERFNNFLRSDQLNKKLEFKNGNSKYLDKVFIKSNEGYHLVLTSDADKVADLKAKGADLDDIKEFGVVYNLPKVESEEGLRYVSQTDTQKKLVSFDSTPVVVHKDKTSSDVIEYRSSDTVDQIIDSFDRESKWVTANVENGKMDTANRAANRGWRNINESKSLTGVSYVYNKDKNGNKIIEKRFSPNRSDFSKAHTFNRTPLIYELPELLKNNEFKDKLIDYAGLEKAKEIENELYRVRGNLLGNGYNVRYLDDLSNSYDINVFMSDNIEYIANSLLESKDFIGRADEKTVSALQEILTFGQASIKAKENDFYRGVSSTRGVHSMVPFSDISNPLRNVQEQSLNATNIYMDSINAIVDDKSIFDGKIKFGMGVHTTESLAKEASSSNKGVVFGMSMKRKIMSPVEYNDRLKGIHDSEAIQEIIKKKILNKHNISDVSNEEIKKVAKLISQSTAPYEDGGSINIEFANMFRAESVGRHQVGEVKKGLKVGDVIRAGDIVGYNKKGKPIVHSGFDSTVKNTSNNEVIYQISEFYNSIKLNDGGSEKGVYSAPNFYKGTDAYNDRMSKIISSVQYHLSDGAVIVSNPSIVKHGSSNTAIIPYLNSISDSIKNDSDLSLVNEAFSKVDGGDYIKFEYNGDKNRYIAINNPKVSERKNNVFEEIEGAIRHIRENSTGEFKEAVNKNLDDVEKGLGYADVFLSQNNTTSSGMSADGYGKGVSASVRSIDTYGKYMELDEGVSSSFKDGTHMSSVVEHLNTLIKKDNLDSNIQVNNIISAMQLQDGREVNSNIKVKKVNISDLVIPEGLVDGEDVPDIFKMASGGESVNVFEVDLSGSNISIDNIFHEKIKPGMTNKQIANFKKKSKKVNKIFIPAMKESYVDGVPMLSETQKSIARLLESMQGIDKKEADGFSIESSINHINKRFKSFYGTMIDEVTSKDGLRVESQKTRNNPGTVRLEAQKVISPELEDGKLKDLHYGNKVTQTDANGNVSYVRSAAVNKRDMEMLGVDFKTLGDDILDMQVAEKGAQFDLLKEFAKENDIDIAKAKNLEEAQKIIKSSNVSDDKLNKLGTKFFEDIGVEAGLSRDPQIRTESFWGVNTTIAEGVHEGGVVTDAVNAQGLKGDIDGDNYNLSLLSFYKDEETGKMRIRRYDSDLREDLRRASRDTSENSMKRVAELSDKVKNGSDKADYTIDAIKGGFVESGMGKAGNYNVNSEDIYKQLYSRVTNSKAVVGQSSNPGLYLKRSSSALVGKVASDNIDEALSISKSINVGTMIAEQSSIDYKLLEHTPDAVKVLDSKIQKAAKMESAWNDMFLKTRNHMKALKGGNAEKEFDSLKSSVVNVIDILKDYSNQDITSYKMMLDESDVVDNKAINELATRILKGDVSRNSQGNTVNLEELIHDVYRMFKDDDSAKMFTSILNRQSLHSAINVNEIDNKTNYKEVLNLIEESSSIESSGVFGDVLTNQVSGNTVSTVPRINGDDLNSGAIMYMKDDTHVSPGVYQMDKTYFDGKVHTSDLIDVRTGETVSLSSSTMDGLSEKFSKASVIDMDQEMEYISKSIDDNVELLESRFKDDYKYMGHIVDLNKSYVDKLDNGLSVSTLEEAAGRVYSSYDMDNTLDLINTLDGLKEMNFEVDHKEVLQQMNQHIKTTGTKEYQKAKRETLMKQNDFVARNVTSNGAYNSLMKDIGSRSKVVMDSNVVDDIKSGRRSMLTLNRKDHQVVGEIVDNLLNEMDESIKNDSKLMQSMKTDAMELLKGIYEKEDNALFEKINPILVDNQHDKIFRKEVLGWDIESAKSFLDVGDKDKALDVLNESILIYSKEHSGKKMGSLNTEQLVKLLDLSDDTGISPEVVATNKEIISEIIDLRGKHGIIYEEIANPIIENYKDDIASVMRQQMQEEIQRKGATRTKTTASTATMRDALDKFKGKVSGMSSKQKMMAGAVAVAGLGATAMIGAQANKSRVELKKANEDEQLIQARSATGQAPPSDKRIYTSDSNAINVNVRGRSPIRGAADGAERAIASLFGHNVSVNSNIQDDRRDISDRDVDMAMEKAIR